MKVYKKRQQEPNGSSLENRNIGMAFPELQSTNIELNP